MERGEAARLRIAEKLPSPPQLSVIQCDVSLKSSIMNAVEEFGKREPNLHCLVCNAGVLLNERKEVRLAEYVKHLEACPSIHQ